MRLTSLAFALLLPSAALAEETAPMDHSKMNHAAMMAMSSDAPAGVTEVGQSAFAALAQIVEVLNADPATDWSKVDIEGLRQHLIDMNNVTLRAQVSAMATPTGARFTVTSPDPEIQASIRRMVAAHAATMNGAGGWTMATDEAPGGAILAVSGTSDDAIKINSLGFIGVMTLGMHHQAHHLMIATGNGPHE